MENNHGNSEKPPTLSTIDGTAVAMMVESMATSPVASMTAMSTGPRSDRNPTPARAGADSPLLRPTSQHSARRGPRIPGIPGIPAAFAGSCRCCAAPAPFSCTEPDPGAHEHRLLHGGQPRRLPRHGRPLAQLAAVAADRPARPAGLRGVLRRGGRDGDGREHLPVDPRPPPVAVHGPRMGVHP